MSPPRRVAVVLAGGRSRRFGSDKLDARLGPSAGPEAGPGRTLLQEAVDGLPAGLDVVVVGPERPLGRPAVFVREEPAGGGPTAALVTGLRTALAGAADEVVVTPGDAPGAGAAAARLLSELSRRPGSGAVVGTDATGFVQPLQLALRRPAAAALVAAAGPDGGHGASARRLLLRLEPPAVPVRLPTGEHFDVDTLDQLRAWAARDGTAVRQVLAAVDALAPGPVVVVALDGRSGTGKSTLASALALRRPASVLPGDDFYAAEPDPRASEHEPIDDDALVDRVFDWRRLRREALEPLRAGRPARYRPYDWAAGDGSLGAPVERPAAPLVLLEGVYSARAGLADLVDLAVLVEVAPRARAARLRSRSDPADRTARWERAEQHYFTRLRPPASFDLRVPGDTEDLAHGDGS